MIIVVYNVFSLICFTDHGILHQILASQGSPALHELSTRPKPVIYTR